MKAKAIIAAILAVHNNAELDPGQKRDQYNGIVFELINKCDDLLKNRNGHYPLVTGLSVKVSFKADRFKMASEPWNAVMHGLQLAGFDPASAGMYPGGFLRKYVVNRLTAHANHMTARNVETFTYARQMRNVIDEIVKVMVDHGWWGDVLAADRIIIEQLSEVQNDINNRLSEVANEVVELAEEALNLRQKGANMTGKQHDRMVGIERYIRNNRSKVECALSLMSADSQLKQQETRILNLLSEIAIDAHIPRPEKKPYEPKPKQDFKKHGNGQRYGGGKHAKTVPPSLEAVLDGATDAVVLNVDNRNRMPSEIMATSQIQNH